jgi:ketosteroid isomerase-like protein
MSRADDTPAALHPLQQAFLAGDLAALADKFTADAVLHSPALSVPFRGREELSRRLLAVAETLEGVQYTGSLQQGSELVWRFPPG